VFRELMQALERASEAEDQRARAQLELARLEDIMGENGLVGRAVAERRRRMMQYGNSNMGGRQYAG
jgi:hypothetical protein